MAQIVSQNARMLSLAAVLGVLGISNPTLYRGIKAGLLPAPVKISVGRVGWRSRDIDRIVLGDDCEVQS